MEVAKNISLLEHYREILSLPQNKDLIGEVGQEIGRGVQGVVFELARSDAVLKLYFDEPDNLQLAQTEAARQEDFYDALWFGYKTGKVPRNFHVPQLLHQIKNAEGKTIGIILSKVHGRSIHSLDTLKEAQKLGQLQGEEEGATMSEGEIHKRFREIAPGYRYFPEDFQDNEADRGFASKIESIKQFFDSHGLHHGDFHSGNVMIGMNGEIYLIDFGKSTIDPRRASKYRHAIEEGRIYRREILLPGGEKDTGTHPDALLLENLERQPLQFSKVEETDFQGTRFQISHNEVPRSIIDQCIVVAYAKLHNMNAGNDSYYFPNIAAYNIGGGYFILGEETRNSAIRNPYSRNVIEAILGAEHLQGTIRLNNGKTYYIFTMNVDIFSIIKSTTRGEKDRILG